MTKLVLKCGDIEVEYEGPEEFLKEELPQLIKAVAELRASKPPEESGNGGGGTSTGPGGLSVSTIAQKLGVTNGPELIISAALSYVKGGAAAFTKKQLRERIREAKTYYKSSYGSNFDNYIGTLVKKGRLNHTSGDSYALPANELTSLNGRLSGTAA
jgi:hypothetical protein